MLIIRAFPGGSDGKKTKQKKQTKTHLPVQEMRVRSLGRGSGGPLEKEMAIHSSILAWEMPWTEEPGRLQFMGLQRVRCDFVTERQLIIYHHDLWFF